MADLTQKDKTESFSSPDSIVGILIEQEKALAGICSDITNYNEQKEGASTLQELKIQLQKVSTNLSNINSAVPGGLLAGTEISFEYRKKIGEMPPEIGSESDLKTISAHYSKLYQIENALNTKLNSEEMLQIQKQNSGYLRAQFAQTSIVLIPAALLGAAALMYGTNDKVALVSIAGTTVILYWTANLAARNPELVSKQTSNMKERGREIIKSFKNHGSSITKHYHKTRDKISACADSLCKRGKGLVEELPKLIQRATKFFDRYKGPKAP